MATKNHLLLRPYLCLPPNARVQLVDSSCGASCASREAIAETSTAKCVSEGNNGVMLPIKTPVRSMFATAYHFWLLLRAVPNACGKVHGV
jgi:hypothetical protein